MKAPSRLGTLLRLAFISAVSAFILTPRQASLVRRRQFEPLRVTPDFDKDFDFDLDGMGSEEEPLNLELSDMVDDLIATAQAGVRAGGGALPEEDILEQSKRMIASMYDKASIEVTEGLQGGQSAVHPSRGTRCVRLRVRVFL
jgi:hypothetical protein